MKTQLVQNKITGEFSPASHGVGFGGQGTWMNTHFCNLQDASNFFDRETKSTIDSYAKMGKYKIEDKIEQFPTEIPGGYIELRRWIIKNIRKDGTIGKIRFVVTLYEIKVTE